MFEPSEPVVKIVLLEYSPRAKRVFVRGVWPDSGEPWSLPPKEPDNQQNYVKVFEGIDHGFSVGFDGLEKQRGG